MKKTKKQLKLEDLTQAHKNFKHKCAKSLIHFDVFGEGH